MHYTIPYHRPSKFFGKKKDVHSFKNKIKQNKTTTCMFLKEMLENQKKRKKKKHHLKKNKVAQQKFT